MIGEITLCLSPHTLGRLYLLAATSGEAVETIVSRFIDLGLAVEAHRRLLGLADDIGVVHEQSEMVHEHVVAPAPKLVEPEVAPSPADERRALLARIIADPALAGELDARLRRNGRRPRARFGGPTETELEIERLFGGELGNGDGRTKLLAELKEAGQ